MEKILYNSQSLIEKNEKLIANILHDIKSPLYSIKFALQNQLNCELNNDIFETTLGIIAYIENFLLNYNFKLGRYDDIENRIVKCDIKEIINKKIKAYKYIFKNKKIYINLAFECSEAKINSIPIFISSIIGNLISNIAFHAAQNKCAKINLYKENDDLIIDFENYYDEENSNFNLGLNFSMELAQKINSQINFSKTKNKIKANLKLKDLIEKI